MKAQRGVLVVFVLLLSSCTSTGDGLDGDFRAGDSAAFCTRWAEARAALHVDIGGRNEWEIERSAKQVRRSLDEVGSVVPAMLRSDWESAIGLQDTVVKLLEIADYIPERLPEVLIDAAFGEGGAEAAASLSRAAIERLDSWSVDECGDFCALWPRLDRALGWGSANGLGGDVEWHVISNGPEDEALILLADGLVPDEVRVNWDGAAGMKLSIVDLYRSWNWEPPHGRISHEEISAHWMDAFGFTQRSLERFFDEMGDTQGPEMDPVWWAAVTISARHRGVIADWSAGNCGVVGTSGLPGVVRVEGPAGGPDGILMAAVPRGTDLAGIEDASDLLGVACSEEHWGWQPWSAPLLDRDDDFSSPCTAPHMDRSEAILPAGDYDLFVGTFPRGFGDFDIYVPAPELCATVPFEVDGDTLVEVPDLEPCDVDPLAGTSEETARRQPPPAPVGPSGTLRVVLTEYFPDEIEGGEYRIVVLPGGTTLNEIGLGHAWPVGSGCVHYRPLEEVDPIARSAILSEGVTVPIQGSGIFPDNDHCGDPVLYAGFEGDRVPPDPIELAAGDYDVYILLDAYSDEERGETSGCATLTVSVEGEVVVEAPRMEECP